MIFLHFWLPIFCCYIFLWAGRSYLCFLDCPNIRKCPLIKLRIFLKHLTSNQNTTSLLAIQERIGIPPSSNTANPYFSLEILYVDPVDMHKHLATWRVVIRASIFNSSFYLSVILEVTTLTCLPLPGALSTVSIPDLKRLIFLVTVEYEQIPCP